MSKSFEQLWYDAVAAADKAEREKVTQTFAVVEHVNPLDDNSPVKTAYTNGGKGFEAEGSCMVKVNGNSAFGRWLKRNADKVTFTRTDHYGGTSRVGNPRVTTGGYYGGVCFFAPPRGYERSCTWAAAFVGVIDQNVQSAKAITYSFID